MLMRKSDNVYDLRSIDAFDLEKNICALADAITSGMDQSNILYMTQRVLGSAHNTNMCISEQKKKIQVLEHDCTTDKLTEVLNRRGFEQELKRLLDTARRMNSHISLIYINLDDIKSSYNKHGHDAGNAVLRKVTHVLNCYSRDNDYVARIGDDEFIILLNDSDLGDAHRRMCTLHWALNHTSVNWQGSSISVTASLGTEAFAPSEPQSNVIFHTEEAFCSMDSQAHNAMNTDDSNSLQYA